VITVSVIGVLLVWLVFSDTENGAVGRLAVHRGRSPISDGGLA